MDEMKKQSGHETSAVREQLRRAAVALATLRADVAAAWGAGSEPPSIYGERLGALLGRRLEGVEGAVAVAMGLAERTGVELRAELRETAENLTAELENVSGMARSAAAAAAAGRDPYAVEASFDEVHHRIDALTRELRLVSGDPEAGGLRAPYGERLATILGRRLQSVEGAVAVAVAQVDRVGAGVHVGLAEVAADGERRGAELMRALDELASRLERIEADRDSIDLASLAAAWTTELRALEVRIGDEIAKLAEEQRGAAAAVDATESTVGGLVDRLAQIERDREAMAAGLIRASESARAERVALQERVAELAARIVTGPVPGAEADASLWPSARAFDQLRIAVEGLRMRLAYHEKEVASLHSGRGVDERIDEMHHLLRRLENAEESVREERDAVLQQLDHVATRIDRRLQQFDGAPPLQG